MGLGPSVDSCSVITQLALGKLPKLLGCVVEVDNLDRGREQFVRHLPDPLRDVTDDDATGKPRGTGGARGRTA